MHFERDVLQAADNPYFPDFHFTFQVSTLRLLSPINYEKCGISDLFFRDLIRMRGKI